MTRRIHPLASLVANQIAAGEVIERPASLVKELLENALDAGAREISVDIGFGGLNCIEVSDDGEGIEADDLPLAIAQHATSKITCLADLDSLCSMGFRGEALASAASVTRLTIDSRPAHQSHAMRLTVVNEGVEIMPCARVQGTTVTARDIFFNAPVRKKFLKSERAEFMAIEQVVKRFALSAPEIGIRLNHNEKNIFTLPPAYDADRLKIRIGRLLGKSFIAQAIRFEVTHAGMGLQGWLGPAACQRSQNDSLWIYLNQRMVRDKLLHHAIKQAYEPLLHPGRYPMCLLYLTLSPSEVDVNVHPTKHEVRFQQPRLIHDFLVSQIQQVLGITEQTSTQAPWQMRPYRLDSIQQPAQLPAGSPWMRIDAQFSLFSTDKSVYLIDRQGLQHYWRREQLKAAAFPWESRALLVPVSCPNLPCIGAWKSTLEQLGVQVDVNEATVQVRTLPLLLPYLDIQAFLRALSSLPLPDVGSACAWLADFHAAPAEEEQEVFTAYLTTHIERLVDTTVLCRRLSGAMCQTLLNA